MRKVFVPGTPAEMYDRALRYAHDSRLPPDYPKPHPTPIGRRKTSPCWMSTGSGWPKAATALS